MDMIDKRDQREKMVRSIIKRRNVIYSPEAYTGEGQGPVAASPQETAAPAASAPAPAVEGNAEAMEVLARLEREAAENEAAKWAEIEKAVVQRDEQQEAISRILNEKEAGRQQVMEAARNGQ